MLEWLPERIRPKETLGKGKILIFGAHGRVGRRFLELSCGNLVTPISSQLDIRDATLVSDLVQKEKPGIVLNLAAYTNVSEAENQRGDTNGPCWQTNVEGPRNLLSALPDSTRLIHFSTDYVFSGQNGPYSETDIPETDQNKLTWYGYTKAEAERIVGNRGTIVRITYPVQAKSPGPDFLRKALDQFNRGKLNSLFFNQQMSITFVDEACRDLQKIIRENLSGVFNMSCPDTTTPYEIITYMLQKLDKDTSSVEQSSVTSVDPRRYPQYGGLTPSFDSSPWREVVDKLIKQGISTS